MRDIAEDLKERIEATQSELALVRTEYEAAKRDLEARYSGRYNKASDKLKALEFLLEEETGVHPSATPARNSSLRLPLPDFLINALVTSGTKSKEELRELVERAGYVSADETAGRMVHTTLLNLVKSGKILQMSDGQYDAAKVNLFE